MSELAESLLRRLADGAARPASSLAAELGAAPAALEAAAARFADWGLPLVRRADGRWQLAHAVELLAAEDLRRRTGGRAPLADVATLVETDSTNARLLAAEPPPPGAIAVCSAEFQTAGRGRRGRRWSTPLAAGLCLSAAWRFAAPPPALGGLTLAIGVAARRALAAAAGVRVALKWPNDLQWGGRKLGGILVETAATADGARRVVAGIGVNVALPDAAADADWRRGAVDLAEATGGAAPSRAALAAELVVELARVLATYAETGFAPYRAEWQDADALAGRPIVLDEDGARSAARAVAVGDDGALLIESAGGVRRRVLAGDVSVRSA